MPERTSQIKERMFRNAARMWGYNSVEKETAFDPLVGLLLSACASELENVSREISDSHVRVTQKLIELMNPGVDAGAFPAHAIAVATPADDTFDLTSEVHFRNQILPSQRNKGEVKISQFISASNTKLFDGRFGFLVYRNKLLYNDKAGERANLNLGERVPDNEIWFGVQISQKIKNIGGLSFYFDIVRSDLRQPILRFLKNAKWSLNGKEIKLEEGFSNRVDEHWIIDKALHGESTNLQECLNQVLDIYKSNFWYLTDKKINVDRVENQKNAPVVPEEVLEELEMERGDLIWFKLEMNQPVKKEFAANINPYINAFPVVNLVINKLVVKAREHLNLLPLNVKNDYFIDVKHIEDSTGQVYKENRSFLSDEVSKKHYTVRSSGVQSFDKRSARELLEMAMEKVKNESTAFRFLDLPTASEDLKLLHQLVSKLEITIQKSSEMNRPVYLYLQGSSPKDHIFVEFWTTLGTGCNSILPNTRLDLMEGAFIKPGSSRFLTHARGGKNRLNHDEQLDAYRKALLTRDRIVTLQDLKAFGISYFGDKINDIEIKHGVAEMPEAHKGLIRSIDIFLKLLEEDALDEDFKLSCNDFMVLIKKKSNNIFPYRIFVNQKILDL
ncbi:MAG: hypothetical protein MI922_05185 [Bacteroidales bacterium]|nr:hypothetical protein [Bacteroidales bacterium]